MTYSISDNYILQNGDCRELVKNIPDNSLDMIFADPPYFLSNGGISCKNGRMVCVDKGDWDKGGTLNTCINSTRNGSPPVAPS